MTRRNGAALAAILLLAGQRQLLAPSPPEAPFPCPSGSLEEALKRAEALPRLHSLLVSRRGERLAEQYFNGARAARPANVKSVSKSVISALVGIAIDRKLLPGVGTPIARYFPELSARGADPKKRAITIGDLLAMRSGLVSTSSRNYGSWVRSPNWVRYVLSRPLESDPGAETNYSTGNTHLLSAILTRATGQSTYAFAKKALAEPLGITFGPWARDPQGIYLGGNEMTMTPRQMLRFGELYLGRGAIDGRRIVSESWIDASFTPRGSSPISGKRHGYGWWISEMAGAPVYYAWGFGGQYIIVAPSLELVVATTSSPHVGEDRRDHRTALWSLLEEVVGRFSSAAACESAPRDAPDDVLSSGL
ncbi:MAG: serine hydrolase [Bryobacteraceae bacterium]|nr:serine hydrolase [Bryobacteraceae bacterium]